MSPSVLLWGFLLFALAVFIHVLWWRIRWPKDDLRMLAYCLVLLPPAAALLLFFFLPSGAFDCLWILLGSYALGAAYFFWYPAAQAISPTMLIVILAYRAGERGITNASLKEAIPEELIAAQSVDNLFHEHFGYIGENGLVGLTARGQRTLAIILFIRRLAGFREPKG